MKKGFIIVLALALLLGTIIIGCNKPNEKTATAYGVFHQEYAGEVTVTMQKDGDSYSVKNVTINEYLPIRFIGVLSRTEDKINGVAIDENHFITDGMDSYARWIKVGGEMFVYDEETHQYTGEKLPAGKTFDKASGEGAGNAFSDAAFTKWYIDAMKAGDYYVCKNAEGTQVYDIPFNAGQSEGRVTTKNNWANKRENGYWAGSSEILGWKGNILAMETAIKEYGMDGYLGTEEKDEEGGFMLGTNITTATLADYHQYMRVAKTAHDMAKAKFMD